MRCVAAKASILTILMRRLRRLMDLTPVGTRYGCLLRVLDEIEFIWAPEDTPRCVETETVPATRDVGQKPYILVDETDRKCVQNRRDGRLQNGKKAYTVEDRLDTLNS
jgi:hypothetical protein